MQGQVGKEINLIVMQYIDSLTRRILARAIFDHMVRHGFVPARGVLRDVFGYALQSRIIKVPKNHALHELFREPDPNTYALGNATLVWLWSYLCKTGPKCIVEMGSGRSTLVLALYVQKQVQAGMPKPTVISIESDESWLAETKKKLDKFGLTGFVHFIQCKLMDNPASDNNAHGYVIDYEKLDVIINHEGIDLLLIDGPSGGHGRGATLPSLAERLDVNADIFLDDASRKKEQESIHAWQNMFGDSLVLKGILPLGSGLARLKLVKKIKS